MYDVPVREKVVIDKERNTGGCVEEKAEI